MIIHYNELPTFKTRTFAFPIQSDQETSFVYFTDLKDEWIVNYNHNDALRSVVSNDLTRSITYPSFIETVDSGANGEAIEVISADLLYWFPKHEKLAVDLPGTIANYQRIGCPIDGIPMMRWIEWIRSYRDRIRFDFEVTDALKVYNNFLLNLRKIESAGLYTDVGFEYSKYDPFTLTGRPSNHNNGVNYAALNKDNGERSRFKSRFVNGRLINVDLTGFHMYLLYLILSFPFPKDIYQTLGNLYPTDVDPKTFTFKQIYGYIDPSLLDKSPFKEINDLSLGLYDLYQRGQLSTLLHEKPVAFPENLPRNKVFNYLLQNLETEFNMMILDDLLVDLDRIRSKLILYTYDSFLFDVHPNEIKDIALLIRDIFKDIPCKIEIGSDYHNLNRIY